MDCGQMDSRREIISQNKRLIARMNDISEEIVQEMKVVASNPLSVVDSKLEPPGSAGRAQHERRYGSALKLFLEKEDGEVYIHT